MGIRSNVDLAVQIGFDNALTNKAFDASLSQLLDSMERVVTKNYELDAAETNVAVDFGDVAEGQLLYVEADGDLNMTIGGSAATSGQIDGAAGTFPTLFAGGEMLVLDIDNAGNLAVTFLVADQTLQQVVNRINSFAALEGLAPIAFVNGGQLRIKSPTTGVSSEVEVVSGTAMATLGLSASVDTGANSTPGTSPIALRATALEGVGVARYFLASVLLTSLVLDNPSADTAVNVKLMIAGDLSVAATC